MRGAGISLRALLIALVAVPIGLAGCSPTATYGTGQAPEVALFREVTGGLLSRDKKKQDIKYQPRAPLVMPPNSESLPPPADSAAVAAADWPVSEDERLADVNRRNSDPRYVGSQAQYRYLKPLADAMDEPSAAPAPSPSHREIVGMRQNGVQFRQALAESKGFGHNERRYLTDPPETYREPAATAPSEFSDINGKGRSSGGGWLGWLFHRGG